MNTPYEFQLKKVCPTQYRAWLHALELEKETFWSILLEAYDDKKHTPEWEFVQEGTDFYEYFNNLNSK